MVTSLLLGVLVDVSFAGGRLPFLAEHLWKENKTPVAIVSTVPMEISKFSYESNADSRARAFKISAKLIQPPGLTLAFYHEDFLRNLVPARPVAYNPSLEFFRGFKSQPGFEKGSVTIHMQGNEGLFCSDLKDLPWSRPLDTHWTMDRAAVFIYCEKVPEADVLSVIAKAYAGRLSIKPKGYSLVLDGAEFRRRALNLYQRFANDDYFKQRNPAEKSAFNLTQIALRAASSKDIEAAFATPESEVAIQLDYGTKEQIYNLLVSAAKEIRSYELSQVNPREQTANLKAPVPPAGASSESFARRVDWNGVVTIYLSANFGARLEATARAQQGQGQKLGFAFPAFNQGREW